LPLQKDDRELAVVFAELLVGGPNTEFQVIDATVATMAADISVRHNLRLPDSFQLAAAVTAGCDAFLTNDAQLRRVPGIHVVILDQIGS
jgi:predicted nucleic acid-binding protein